MSDQQKNKEARKCLKCHYMYGNPIWNDLCSVCYKNEKKQTKQEGLQQLDEDNDKDQPTKTLTRIKTDADTHKFLKKDRTIIQKQPKQLSEKNEEKTQKIVMRCTICNKKTGMLGYSCKHCTNNFCKFHRLPEDHQCEIDFISEGQKKLKKENPVIEKAKIQKI